MEIILDTSRVYLSKEYNAQTGNSGGENHRDIHLDLAIFLPPDLSVPLCPFILRRPLAMQSLLRVSGQEPSVRTGTRVSFLLN